MLELLKKYRRLRKIHRRLIPLIPRSQHGSKGQVSYRKKSIDFAQGVGANDHFSALVLSIYGEGCYSQNRMLYVSGGSLLTRYFPKNTPLFGTALELTLFGIGTSMGCPPHRRKCHEFGTDTGHGVVYAYLYVCIYRALNRSTSSTRRDIPH